MTTRRAVTPIGEYSHKRDLVELALRGLHPDDENAGSDFLEKTSLSYDGAPLPDTYAALTPAWLAQQMGTLQPRIDFRDLQKQLHAKTELCQAIEAMLDHRINALACTAMLQGHLTADDFELIQRVRQGSDPLLSVTILALHERWDGTGYPNSLSGERIPLFARIIAIADSYDAMIEDRPYRKALSVEQTLAEITRCSGTQFDPELARIFVRQVAPELNSGVVVI